MSTRAEPLPPVRIRRFSLEAAATKYLRLGVEIEALAPGGPVRDNLLHTHSKLGIFLDEAIGEVWREAKREARGEGEWRD